MTDTPQPSSAPVMVKQFAGVVVDGYCFSKRYGRSVEVLTLLRDAVGEHISNVCSNVSVRVHPDAMVFFFPNPVDARKKQLISDAEALETLDYLDKVRCMGWKVLHSDFKRVGGETWKASSEDVAFANECAKLCRTGELGPIGGDATQITLQHLVIVTGDNDHITTFTAQSNSELRWLVDMNPASDPNQRLRRAANEASRMVVFSAPLVAAGRTTTRGPQLPPSAGPEVCDQGAYCRAYECSSSHPDSRPNRCSLDCDSMACEMLHPTLQVRTLDGTLTGLPSNHVLNTVGKKNAAKMMRSTREPPKLCKYGASNCRRKADCLFIHVHAPLIIRKADVPAGFVLCDSELVAEENLEDNAGKLQAIEVNHRRGNWCCCTPCTQGDQCTSLHRRFAPSVTFEIQALRQQVAKEQARSALPSPASIPSDQVVPLPKQCLICDDELSPGNTFECSAGHALCHPCFSRTSPRRGWRAL